MPRRLAVQFFLPHSQADWAGQALADVFPDGLLQRPASNGLTRLTGWPRQRFPPKELGKLRARLAMLGARGTTLRHSQVKPWNEQVRARYPVQALGRFLIVPQWKRRATRIPRGKHAIYLLQGQAFGTGLHESTRLMLKAVADLGRRSGMRHASPLRGSRGSLHGMDVLDVGAGSGVLGFAALKMGGRHVSAVEVEAAAVKELRLNRALNGVGPAELGVTLGAFPLRRLRRRYGLVLANLVTPLIEREMPALRARLAPGGRLLCSGIHGDAEARRVAAAARRAGLKAAGKAALRGWRRLDFLRPG